MMGRPTRWDSLKMEDKLILVEGWARDGATDKQICEFLGVSEGTLYKWKHDYPEFKEALSKGKEVVDRMVENALLKTALGFEYEEEMVTNKGTVVKVTKQERPNVTAQRYWLNNRKSAEWRERQESTINTNVQITDTLSPEEREKRIKELMDKVDPKEK